MENGSLALSPLTFDINVFVGGLWSGSKQVIHPLNPSLDARVDGVACGSPTSVSPISSPPPPLRLSTPYSRPRVIRSPLLLPSLLPQYSSPSPFSFLFTRVHDLFLHPRYFMKRECTHYTASWRRSASPYPCNVIVSTPKRGKERSQVDTHTRTLMASSKMSSSPRRYFARIV